MQKYKNLLIKIFFIALILLIIILSLIFGIKKSFKLITPSLIGVLGATGLTALVFRELNLFSIITLFLVLGFTIDYSIFRLSKTELNKNRTETAIFVSFLTTSFSFLLLSFCGFKLLSSMAVILFFGIIISYLTGYFLFLEQKN